MAIRKYDWIELKKDWLSGDDKSVKAFCKRKGLPDPSDNSFVAEKTKGWTAEKEVVRQKALEEYAKKSADHMLMDTKEVRLKHAKAARQVIEKATEFLIDQANTIKNVEEARKLLETGVKIERDALGINDKVSTDQTLTQINIYASKFGEIIDKQDEQGLTKLITAIRAVKRAGASVSGEHVNGEAGQPINIEA